MSFARLQGEALMESDWCKRSRSCRDNPIFVQVKYPENFFLLRGNHECASINRIYGFYDECKRRYNIRLWKIFTDCFNCLPVAALIDEKVQTYALGVCRWSSGHLSVKAWL